MEHVRYAPINFRIPKVNEEAENVLGSKGAITLDIFPYPFDINESQLDDSYHRNEWPTDNADTFSTTKQKSIHIRC